ncbi:twin-arginine translocation signal domain-containing protein [Mucilaginibacter antarcticus]|uniref:twin-arginine translocation signal domain-containing protein n=1 Tax=Mucilaginibacter antarcticus TaxID=1855725 RepID=UPI00362EEAA9
MEKRREFIKKAAIAAGGIAIGTKTFGFTAKSYNRIIGANERINVAIIGLNGREAVCVQRLPNKLTAW